MVDTVNNENPRVGAGPRWWRRNRWWLVGLCVIAPLTFGAVYAKAARDFDGVRIDETPPVAVGSTITQAGRTIGPVTAREGSDSGAPERTHVVHVKIPISSPTAGSDPVEVDGLGCNNIVLREQTGAHRTWSEASSKLADVDPFPSQTICDPALPDGYELGLSFLVPDDADGPFVVGFESGVDPVVALEFQVQT